MYYRLVNDSGTNPIIYYIDSLEITYIELFIQKTREKTIDWVTIHMLSGSEFNLRKDSEGVEDLLNNIYAQTNNLERDE